LRKNIRGVSTGGSNGRSREVLRKAKQRAVGTAELTQIATEREDLIFRLAQRRQRLQSLSGRIPGAILACRDPVDLCFLQRG